MDHIEKIITEIAQAKLGVETLDKRMCDRLDFHDLPVWLIKEALEEAFNAGAKTTNQGA